MYVKHQFGTGKTGCVCMRAYMCERVRACVHACVWMCMRSLKHVKCREIDTIKNILSILSAFDTTPKDNLADVLITMTCVVKISEECRCAVRYNLWQYREQNVDVNSEVNDSFVSGGIAQWQSIRLQIERSPVQLWLPPLLFVSFFLPSQPRKR